MLVAMTAVAIRKRNDHRHRTGSIGRIGNVHIQRIALGIRGGLGPVVDRGIVLEIAHIAGQAVTFEKDIGTMVGAVGGTTERAAAQGIVDGDDVHVDAGRLGGRMTGIVHLHHLIALVEQPLDIGLDRILADLLTSQVLEIDHSHVPALGVGQGTGGCPDATLKGRAGDTAGPSGSLRDKCRQTQAHRQEQGFHSCDLHNLVN